jgi:hypothetical protein
MADRPLLDGLISTYRELNAKVRPLPEDRLRLKGSGNASVRDVVTRLRDSELRFSQALKERITGVPMPEMFGEDEAPVVGTEGSNDSTAVVLSQFGTARESTLAMLRGLPDADWDQPIEGGVPIRGRIQELVDNDRRLMERIVGLLGAP